MSFRSQDDWLSPTSTPDWSETAGRVRGRIDAQWKNHLDRLLPARSKVRQVVHHTALPYSELGEFMGDLRLQLGVSAAALEFLILTGSRTGEVLGARWHEIDITSKVWTIPGNRMKGGRQHRVPLSGPALAVLDRMKHPGTEYVFQGLKRSEPLSNMASLVLLRRMGRDGPARGMKTGFFFPDSGGIPAYLDPRHPRYAPKLAAAVQAWLAIENESAVSGKSPKQALARWLREQAVQFGLTDSDGKPNETGIEEIAKVANWQLSGGAPKTPGG